MSFLWRTRLFFLICAEQMFTTNTGETFTSSFLHLKTKQLLISSANSVISWQEDSTFLIIELVIAEFWRSQNLWNVPNYANLRQKNDFLLDFCWCIVRKLFKCLFFNEWNKLSWFYYINLKFKIIQSSNLLIKKVKKEESLSFSKVFNGLVGIGFGSIKSKKKKKNGQQPYETKPTNTFWMRGK